MKIRLMSVLFLTATALSLPAPAQPRDATAADALFRQGRAAMKQGDYVTACPKFAESFRLDPAAGTALNLAQCEDKIGMYASAAQHYQEALDLLSPGDPRIAVAKTGLASARKRSPKLTVRIPENSPPGTIVLRDGVELGAVSIGTPLPIDPGEHTLVTKAPGHEDRSETVSIAAGEYKETTIVIGAPLPERTTKSQDPLLPSANVKPSGSMLPFLLGGVGLVSLGAGTYFVYRAKSKDDDAKDLEHYGDKIPNPTNANNGNGCDQTCYDLTQESRTNSTIAYGLLVGGGLLVAGGAVMLLIAPSQDEETVTKPIVDFAIGPGTVGAQVGGVW